MMKPANAIAVAVGISIGICAAVRVTERPEVRRLTGAELRQLHRRATEAGRAADPDACWPDRSYLLPAD